MLSENISNFGITKICLELGLLLHYPIIHSGIGETFEVKFPIIRITSKKILTLRNFVLLWYTVGVGGENHIQDGNHQNQMWPAHSCFLN